MSTITERAKALSRAGVWRPTVEGEVVAGQVVEVEEITDLFQQQKIRLEIIDQESGENVTVFCNSWLGAEISRLGVKAGDQLGIRFNGRHKSKKSGFEYAAFAVVHEAANG